MLNENSSVSAVLEVLEFKIGAAFREAGEAGAARDFVKSMAAMDEIERLQKVRHEINVMCGWVL